MTTIKTTSVACIAILSSGLQNVHAGPHRNTVEGRADFLTFLAMFSETKPLCVGWTSSGARVFARNDQPLLVPFIGLTTTGKSTWRLVSGNNLQYIDFNGRVTKSISVKIHNRVVNAIDYVPSLNLAVIAYNDRILIIAFGRLCCPSFNKSERSMFTASQSTRFFRCLFDQNKGLPSRRGLLIAYFCL